MQALSEQEAHAYVEALYRKYLAEPTSVADEWRRYFGEISGNGQHGVDQTRRDGTPAAAQ